jgi:threonine dehydratase
VTDGGLAVDQCELVAGGSRDLCEAEHLQPDGSFRIRGATNDAVLLTDEYKQRGVIGYSTGNHTQAVAPATQAAGVAATIVMSPDVPKHKNEKMQRLGARVLIDLTDFFGPSGQRLLHGFGPLWIFGPA